MCACTPLLECKRRLVWHCNYVLPVCIATNYKLCTYNHCMYIDILVDTPVRNWYIVYIHVYIDMCVVIGNIIIVLYT